MALVDSIIGAESGGDPNAVLCALSHMSDKFWAYSRVLKLLFACGPSAIVGAVVSIAVDAVNGIFLAWPLAHVRKEVFKSSPSVANLNSSTAVKVEVYLARICAALDHAAPYLILCRCLTTTGNGDRHPVRTIGGFGCLNLVTTAARGISGFKIRDRNGDDAPAVTPTNHPSYRGYWPILSEFRLCFRSGDQPAKSHANIVDALAWGQL